MVVLDKAAGAAAHAARVGSPARLQVPPATAQDDPQEVSRQLDQVIAGNAFERAALAFAEAAASARTRDMDKARKLAAEADSHLAMAQRALNGLRYVPYVAPSRRGRNGRS